MEAQVKQLLETTKLKSTGYSGGGCISSGATYEIDNGKLVFVKVNNQEHAKKMFDGEHAGLEAILATNTIQVPKSFGTFQVPGSSSSGIVLEHINMKSLRNQTLLGQKLAELHLHNENLLNQQKKQESSVTKPKPTTKYKGEENLLRPVTQFGFHIPTSCGYISMENDWNDNWTKFYISQRLQAQIDLLSTKNSSNRNKLSTIWSQCMLKIEKLLNAIKPSPVPALLHGDLWSGNVAAAADNDEPIIFDPATFYGHSEFDLGIGQMFGGFNSSFHNAYHNLIPKTDGFKQRILTYELFHHLNHWNHFGSGYESSSLNLMKQIIHG